MRRNISTLFGIAFTILSMQNALCQGRIYWIQLRFEDYVKMKTDFDMVIDTPYDVFYIPEEKNNMVKSFLGGGHSNKFNKNRMSFVIFLENKMYLIDEDGNVLHESNITKVNLEKFEDLLSTIIPPEKRRSKSVGDINNIMWGDIRKP